METADDLNKLRTFQQRTDSDSLVALIFMLPRTDVLDLDAVVHGEQTPRIDASKGIENHDNLVGERICQHTLLDPSSDGTLRHLR